MALRTPYCLPVDVLRKFDPTLSRSSLEDDMMFAADDLEKFRAEIADACDEFDTKTGNAQRLTRVGRGDAWEYHDAELRRHQGGVKVYLEHRHVLPIDHSEGDRIELRTTRDRWKDITEADDRYRLNAPDGILQIFTRRVALRGRHRRAMIDDNIRVKYRYGALGGERGRSGQTELAEEMTSGASSVAVEDASRLPRSGLLLIAGDGTNEPEYARATADAEADELTSISRGLRGTEDSDHGSGAAVHYCPTDVRKAVAGRVATEFVRSDDIADNLPTPDDNVGHTDKMEAWDQDWRDALGKYSEAHMI